MFFLERSFVADVDQRWLVVPQKAVANLTPITNVQLKSVLVNVI